MSRKEIIESMIAEEMLKAKSVGIKLNSVVSHINVNDNDTAFASISSYGQITVNRKFLENAPIDEIRSTIAHEICHRTVGSYGHDAVWRKSVSLMNRAFGNTYVNGDYHLHPHPYSKSRHTLPHFSMLDSDSIDNVSYKYVAKCKGCGQTIRRKKFSKFFQYMDNYSCGCCGSSFERVK